MSRFDAELVTRPGLQERLDGVDPWVFQAVMVPHFAQQLRDFEHSVMESEQLTLRDESGMVHEFTRPCVTAYSEAGHLIHLRQAENGAIGAVIGRLEDETAYQSYIGGTMRHESIPSYGLPSEISRTTYTLTPSERGPLLTDAARPAEADALAYAAATLQRQREREVVTISSAGWSYKPAGTLATVRLHDWSNIKQQCRLIEVRGFSLADTETTSSQLLESFAEI